MLNLRKLIREELTKVVQEYSSDIYFGSLEPNRAQIGKKVIDNVRKNNPDLDDMERERIRKIEDQ